MSICRFWEECNFGELLRFDLYMCLICVIFVDFESAAYVCRSGNLGDHRHFEQCFIKKKKSLALHGFSGGGISGAGVNKRERVRKRHFDAKDDSFERPKLKMKARLRWSAFG